MGKDGKDGGKAGKGAKKGGRKAIGKNSHKRKGQ